MAANGGAVAYVAMDKPFISALPPNQAFAASMPTCEFHRAADGRRRRRVRGAYQRRLPQRARRADRAVSVFQRQANRKLRYGAPPPPASHCRSFIWTTTRPSSASTPRRISWSSETSSVSARSPSASSSSAASAPTTSWRRSGTRSSRPCASRVCLRHPHAAARAV